MQLPHGTTDAARLHREWLKKLPALTGKSLTRIAQDSKISSSTLTRPLQEGEHGTSTLHARTIEKILAAFPEVDAPPGMTPPHPEGARSGLREDAAEYRPEPGDALDAALRALAGPSGAIVPWTLKTRALELAGFLPGDVVLVDLGNTEPKPGEAVCAQVYDWKGMRADTMMRIYERAAPVDLLVVRTADPAIAGQSLVVDGERVIIKGVLLPHRLRAV